MNTTMNQPTTRIAFNINQTVRVKLTQHGRAFHAMQHAMFNMKTGRDIRYTPPVEDAEGWSEWQLHELAHQFGEQLYNGNTELPFETNIQLVKES
jgi:hypothetical protein